MTKILSLLLIFILFSFTNDEQQSKIKFDPDVKNNIIHCENNKFIIKIDQLKSGNIRYTSWNKPNTIADKPNLVIYNGEIEKYDVGLGHHYIFKNEEWHYIIENHMEDMDYSVYLKLLHNGVQKHYWKMKRILKNYDLKTYSKQNLIGNWWTRYNALRKVDFFDNNTFTLYNGNGKKINGKYKLVGTSVILDFDNGLDKVLKIGGGKDNTSFTLVGERENFIKKWED